MIGLIVMAMLLCLPFYFYFRVHPVFGMIVGVVFIIMSPLFFGWWEEYGSDEWWGLVFSIRELRRSLGSAKNEKI